jgi:hypothetical protein
LNFSVDYSKTLFIVRPITIGEVVGDVALENEGVEVQSGRF